MDRPSPPLSLRDGQLQYERRGLRYAPFSDLYHAVLRASWTGLLAWTVSLYGLTNLVFAGLFLAGGDCINAENPKSFLEAFSFSVQTFSTIGYGNMWPTTPWAHFIVFVESIVGLIGVAMVTGLCFAKFARPEALVSFSARVCVRTRNGRPVLMFRMANERNSRIIDGHAQVYVLVEEVTSEGERMRRFYPLTLERERTPIFLLTWSVLHYLDGNSPLVGLTADNIEQRMLSLVAILVGTDDAFVQNVHAQHYYLPADFRFNERFVDLVDFEDGRIVIHHDRLHDTVPLAAASGSTAQPHTGG